MSFFNFHTLEVRQHRLYREGHVIVVFVIVMGDLVRYDEGLYEEESQSRVGHDGFEELSGIANTRRCGKG